MPFSTYITIDKATGSFNTAGTDIRYLVTTAGLIDAGPGDAAEIQGSDDSFIIEGEISAAGIGMNFTPLTGDSLSDELVVIGKTGSVTGAGTGYGAIAMGATHSIVENSGSVWGDTYGVYFNGVTDDGKVSRIDNFGSMTSQGYGIDALGAEELIVRNSGTISGPNGSFFEASGGAIDRVINTGEMLGNVVLGGGNDYYDGRKGDVDGTVFGGDGNDVLYGGAEDNIIEGDAGKNTLMGGQGNDSFVFAATLAKGNVDTILDFSHSDDTFMLDSSMFTGLKAGNLPTSAFKEISSPTSTAGVDGSDRILYDKADGNLYFDQDGSGTHFDRILFAHVTDGTILDNTDFQIF